MTNILRIAAIASVAALASSSTAMSPQPGSPEAAQRLARALAGRAAGPATACVPNFRSSEMKVIDDSQILFGSGRTVYLQRPAGGCPGLGTGSNTLVALKAGTNRLCEGDINQVVDARNGIIVGSCVFKPFIPYTRAN